MLRLLADENLDRTVVAGVRSQLPDLEFLIAQESGLGGTADPDLLAWAADQDRIVVSHDVNTMTKFAIERRRQRHRMPACFSYPARHLRAWRLKNCWKSASAATTRSGKGWLSSRLCNLPDAVILRPIVRHLAVASGQCPLG
jgi:hypothetical protein